MRFAGQSPKSMRFVILSEANGLSRHESGAVRRFAPQNDRAHRGALDFRILPRGGIMAVDPELLAILVCPKTKGPLELIELKEETRRELVEKYREKFRGEEPVVTQGLYSKQADLVYPIVSDIPVMLVEEALPGSEAR